MVRSLLHLVAAVSLLLMVAAVTSWVRGYWTVDTFWLVHGDDGTEMLRSGEGRLTVRHDRPNVRTRFTWPRRVSHWPCRAGSQLPPPPSPLHRRWWVVTYEGTREATRAEIDFARAAVKQAEALRAAAQIPAGSRGWYATRFRTPEQEALLPTLEQAELLEARGQDLLRGSSYWEWSVPAWLAVLAFAAPPALWLAGWRRRRRWACEGRCPACGYDLRASRDRCPECGRPMPGAPRARGTDGASLARAGEPREELQRFSVDRGGTT